MVSVSVVGFDAGVHALPSMKSGSDLIDELTIELGKGDACERSGLINISY